MTLKNSKSYKKLRNEQILNGLWLFMSELLVIHPIAWFVVDLNLHWVFILTTIVCSTLGAISFHTALNNIRDYSDRMYSLSETYHSAVANGITPEAFCAALDFLDNHAEELRDGPYHAEFDEFGGFNIISDETGETIFSGRAYEDK